MLVLSKIDYFTCFSWWIVVICHFRTVHMLLEQIFAGNSQRVMFWEHDSVEGFCFGLGFFLILHCTYSKKGLKKIWVKKLKNFNFLQYLCFSLWCKGDVWCKKGCIYTAVCPISWLFLTLLLACPLCLQLHLFKTYSINPAYWERFIQLMGFYF